MMTRKGMERIVATWQTRLKLDHWEVKIDWARQVDPSDLLAEISFDEQYDNAKLRLASNWSTWKRDVANQTVAHELLHLHERDLNESVKSVSALLGKPAYTVFYERMMHEREGLVDRLATVLVELGGAV